MRAPPFRFLIAGCLGLALSTGAFAQAVTVPTVPAPQPIQPPRQIQIVQSHAEAAKELMVVSHTIDAFQNMLPAIMRQIGQSLTATNLTLQADPAQRAVFEEGMKAVEQDLANEREVLIADVALLYAARFSEAELKTIIAFMKTPEGQKFVALSPYIAQDSFRLAGAWSERVSQIAFEKIRAEMKKRNITLQ